MAQTITAEARAEKLHGDLCEASVIWSCKHHHVKDLIAAAIRDAENAALEGVALLYEDVMAGTMEHLASCIAAADEPARKYMEALSTFITETLGEISSDRRSLKHPESA